MTENLTVLRTASRRRRGVTLIEAVLYIAIALALIVGGLVFYQQAVLASRVNSAARSMSALVVESRVIAKDSGQVTLTDIQMENVLLAQGSVPSDLIDLTRPAGQRIRNPWGSRFAIALQDGGAGALVQVFVRSFPVQACARLSVIDPSGRTTFSTNVQVAFLSDDTGAGFQIVQPGVGPAATAAACRAADGNGNGSVWAQYTLRVAD